MEKISKLRRESDEETKDSLKLVDKRGF